MSAGHRFGLALLAACALVGGSAAADAPRVMVREQEGRWSLVAPQTGPFFSLGVCVLNRGATREEFDPANPAYAAWQYYGAPRDWADDSLRRLESWGFTTVGAWSDFPTLVESQERVLWLAPVAHIGSTAGAPWLDMWDPTNLARMERVARQTILPLCDNPRVIGFYVDNEVGWWNARLWQMTLKQAPGSGQRQRLLAFLRETYDGDWRRLTSDFNPEGATNWEDLSKDGVLWPKPGSNGVRVMRRFLSVLADRYYQLMRDVVHKHAPGSLYLGDRYQSFYYPEVAQVAARYVDVVSTNVNAFWHDGTFPRFQLETLHALTGKPIMIGEFYAAAQENRSGDTNDHHGTYPVVQTQRERAALARTTIEAMARLPYVVGADWFQYYDEPPHGRWDGENYNFGLVDIHNQPYDGLTSMFASLDLATLHAATPPHRPDATGGVPPAPEDPLASFTRTEALKAWDRERGFVPASSPDPIADLYACWSPRAVTLGLLALDYVESAYEPKGVPIPEEDRAFWTVRINDCAPIHVRLGADREAAVDNETVRVASIPGINLNPRNVAAIEVPAELFGLSSLRSGDPVKLDVTLATHGRAYSVSWQGQFALRN